MIKSRVGHRVARFRASWLPCGRCIGAILVGVILWPLHGLHAQNRSRPATGAARQNPTTKTTKQRSILSEDQTVKPASVTENSASTRQAIDALYKLSSEATTVGQIQQAIIRGENLRAQPLGNETLQYLNELQAWLLNRRGEAHSQAADRSSESGSEKDATAQEQQAQADFLASIELNPHWRAYHNLGVSLAMTGSYDQALKHFDAAVDRNPNYPNTRFNRAELWLEIGKYEWAEREYSEVIRLNPDDVDARIGRGHSRFYLGRFDEALSDFNEVIQLQPNSAVALADRADLYAYLGRWEEAAQDYRAAIGLDKQLGRAFQSAAWLMATCPEDNYRDTALALRVAERAIQLDGTVDYRYLDTLAAAQANANQVQEAQQSLQSAIKVAPVEIRPELQERMTLYQAQKPFRDVTK